MPFTTEQQDEILKKNGLDPASHFMDLQTGDIYKKPTVNQPQAQPSFEAPSSQELTTRPDQKPMSWAEAVEVQLKGAMLPFGTGAAGGALGTRAAMGLGARLGVGGGPIGVGIGAILGGIGGSLAGEYLQNKSILSPEFQAKRAQADEQWPLLSAGTRLLPNAITTNVRQSVKDLGTLAKALVKSPAQVLTGREAILPAGKAMLANAGVNVGVAGGMEAYNERQKYLQAQQEGVPYEPNKLAIAANVLIPSLLSTPRAWYSKAMGFKPTGAGEAPTGLDTTGTESAASRAALEGRVPKVPRPETTFPAGIKARESKLGNTLSFIDSSLPMNHLFKYKGEDFITVKGDLFKNKEGKELRRVTARKLATHEEAIPALKEGYNDRDSIQAIDEDIARYDKYLAQRRQFDLGSPEGKIIGDRIETIKNKYGGLAPRDFVAEQIKRDQATPPDTQRSSKIALTEDELKQYRDADTKEKFDKLAPELQKKILARLEESFQMWGPLGALRAAKRGYNVVVDPNLKQAGVLDTGALAQGDRTVWVGPKEQGRGAATIDHEAGAHGFLRDLAFSDKEYERNLAKKIQERYNYDISKNDKLNKGNEEEFAQAFEKIIIDANHGYGNRKKDAIRFLQAVKDNMRLKSEFLLGPTPKETLTRIHADKYINDIPYAERSAKFGKMYEAAGVKPVADVSGLAEEADTREGYRHSEKALPDDYELLAQIGRDSKSERARRLNISPRTYERLGMYKTQPYEDQQALAEGVRKIAPRGDARTGKGIDLDNISNDMMRHIAETSLKAVKIRRDFRGIKDRVSVTDGISYVMDRLYNEGVGPSQKLTGYGKASEQNRDILQQSIYKYADRWAKRIQRDVLKNRLVTGIEQVNKEGDAIDESKNILLSDKSGPEQQSEALAAKEEIEPTVAEENRPASQEELESLKVVNKKRELERTAAEDDGDDTDIFGEAADTQEPIEISLFDKDAEWELGKRMAPNSPRSQQLKVGQKLMEYLKIGGDDAVGYRDILAGKGLTIKEDVDTRIDTKRSSERAIEEDDYLLNKYSQINFDKDFKDLSVERQQRAKELLSKYRETWLKNFKKSDQELEERNASHPEYFNLRKEIQDDLVPFFKQKPNRIFYKDGTKEEIPASIGDAYLLRR